MQFDASFMLCNFSFLAWRVFMEPGHTVHNMSLNLSFASCPRAVGPTIDDNMHFGVHMD